ncbi:hypothetical protein PILCRDRAFT_464831 [Piloderma croceum F 1598]|uniref:Uncharacterized protein n=1 Tax=Piloderma croceum (strain F 1598) TaxID=765440 RepID=A0A0C3BYQ4_PILCF|nr:hypothetical protein PILCRDRAFT_464831 [Piloderma croceum F 1598]
MTTSADLVEDPLEKIFQQLEQGSKQCRQDEDQGSTDASTVEAVELNTWPKDRRRSVSISVLGQLPESSTDTTTSNPSFTISPLASAASKSPFYHSLMNTKSVDTVISDHSLHDGTGNQAEEDHHVTRMQTIGGRSNSISKTIDKVGALLSRSSTQRKHARASSIIPLPAANAGVVIDVRVESATVEADSDQDKFRYATVHADEPAIRRAAWFGMPSSVGSGSIAMKAKGLTQKFRQRSKPELPNSETAD